MSDDPRLEPGEPPPEDQADEALDLSQIDPEAWRPGIPWWPGFSLIGAVVALPVISIWLSGIVADRLAAESPKDLGAIDAWRALIQATLIAGAVLILVVPIIARLVRGRTTAIIRLLETGFPIGVILVAIVVLLHSALAFAIVMGVERLILGRAVPGSAGLVALAGLASAVYLLREGLSRLRPSTGDVAAIPIDRSTAPGLFATIDDLAARLGLRPPEAVLLGPSMEFWSSHGSFRTLNEPVAGNVIHVSLPAMAVLSRPQVEAILAHELGHLRNGDTDVGARLGPAFERVAASVQALDRESEGIGRIAATPGRLWLDFAVRAMFAVVFEQRRESETRADAVEAELVGAEQTASALLAHVAVSMLEDGWADAVGKAIEDGEGDPLEELAKNAREAFADATGRDVLQSTLENFDPDHPAVLSRIRALGQEDAPLDLTGNPALPSLVADPAGVATRLWDTMRESQTRIESMHLNPPRVTPGVVGWVLVGIVFALIFAVRGVGEGESLQIAVAITAVWLLFPIVYPYLQHEAELDQVGFRTRPWWYRFVDRDATRLQWKQVRWTGSMSLKLQAESWATLSNGLDSASWWAGIWPKRELARLIDEVRARGASVDFSVMASVEDVERHAVVWYIAGRFLVPEMRAASDGGLITVKPVKSLGTGALNLSFALIDRLHEPVPAANPNDVVVQPSHLAEAAKVDLATFEAEARRADIHGSRDEWIMTIDGIQGDWRAPRKVDELDIAEMLIEILHTQTLAEAGATEAVGAGDERASDEEHAGAP